MLYAIILPVMLGMVGLAIDLSVLYARGHELQAIADGAALAAARALDGTEDGLAKARDNARRTAKTAEYRFLHPETIDWTSAALNVGPSRDGPWVLEPMRSAPANCRACCSPRSTPARSTRCMAGSRSPSCAWSAWRPNRTWRGAPWACKDSSLGPLAICALSTEPLGLRTNAPAANAEEAIEFGFRRGVGYNLLNLNASGSTARSFVVNPLDYPAGALAAFASGRRRPASVRLQRHHALAPPIQAGSTLYVREPFPVAMVAELNSRFASYNGGSVCTKYGAPPDSNVIDFRGPYGGFWISGTPARAAARQRCSVCRRHGKLATVADADLLPPGTTAASYGTLWAFSRPLRYTGGTAGCTVYPQRLEQAVSGHG
ncbi:pilus assembly protein TadG-related protein [Massilia sp. H-1]|nr:pilus assembly protein TadG-related protein [Massilia sp. H-1]